jgi:hypothetical protein
MDNDLELIYIMKVGESHNDEHVYEFIFSDNSEEAVGTGWEDVCLYSVNPPSKEFVNKVATLKTKKIELSLLTEMSEWRYLDGVYGAVAIGWEYIEDYRTQPLADLTLLKFFYGETLEAVAQKLSERGMTLKAD